jgi:hypothetical protein
MNGPRLSSPTKKVTPDDSDVNKSSIDGISETFTNFEGPVGGKAFGDTGNTGLGEGVFAGINIGELRRRQQNKAKRGIPKVADEFMLDNTFIPISISDLIYLLAMRIGEEEEQTKFIRFCRHLCYHIHVALYDEYLISINAYNSQDPDRDTERIFDYVGMEDLLDQRFTSSFKSLVKSANFTCLANSQAGTDDGMEVISDAMAQKSKDGLNIEFNGKPFTIKMFARGQRNMKRRRERDILNFVFWAKEWDVCCYRRLIVSFELKEDVSKCNDKLIQPNCVYMKMFKDFPHDDVCCANALDFVSSH